MPTKESQTAPYAQASQFLRGAVADYLTARPIYNDRGSTKTLINMGVDKPDAWLKKLQKNQAFSHVLNHINGEKGTRSSEDLTDILLGKTRPDNALLEDIFNKLSVRKDAREQISDAYFKVPSVAKAPVEESITWAKHVEPTKVKKEPFKRSGAKPISNGTYTETDGAARKLKKWIIAESGFEDARSKMYANGSVGIRKAIIKVLFDNKKNKPQNIPEDFETIIKITNNTWIERRIILETQRDGFPLQWDEKRLKAFATFLEVPKELHSDFVKAFTPPKELLEKIASASSSKA